MKQTIPPLLPDERLDRVNEQITLIQKKQGLTFGTDAFLLAAFIRPQPCAHAVDLGSGTGIIPLLLCAKQKVARVTAVEIQPSFADLIRRNAELNGQGHRITPLLTDVRDLKQSQIGGEVELVCANPPYLPVGAGRTNRDTEKELARHEIAGTVWDFCAAAGRLLKTKGRFVCVFRPERLCDLFEAMRNNRLEPKRLVTVYGDTSSPPSMVLVEAGKDAAPGLSILPPLFLYQDRDLSDPSGRREMTPRAAAIYEACSFSPIEKDPHTPNQNEKENTL